MILYRKKKDVKNGGSGERNRMLMKLMVIKNVVSGENGERRMLMILMVIKNVQSGENGERKMLVKMKLVKKKCAKWRKWREENGEKDEEGKGRGRRNCRGAWGGGRGRGAWRKFHGGVDSDSDSAEETRPVEEIKKEINSLKEEIGALVAKKKGLWEELVGLKSNIKNLRQNEGTSDEILKVREDIMEKKRVVREYHVQIANSKNRIWKLKSALVMRVDTN